MHEPHRRRGWLGGARLRDDLPGLLSLLLFMTITALIFRSWEFGLLVTASLGFHELGHALALARLRVEYRVLFGVVGAYTWSRLDQRRQLSHLQNSAVHLAGPLFSLLLALAALGLNAVWRPQSTHLLVLADFSAQVGFLNLLPLGALTDGGKVLRRMVRSAGRRSVRVAMMVFAGGIALAPLLLALHDAARSGGGLPAAGAGLALIGVWMAASLLIELRRGDPDGPQDGRGLTPRQIVALGALTWGLLAAMLVVILITPFWLEPRLLLGSLANIEMLVGWLLRVF